MNYGQYRDFQETIHNMRGNVVVLKMQFAQVRQILLAEGGTDPKSENQLRKVQEARTKFVEEIERFQKVYKSEITEPDSL